MARKILALFPGQGSQKVGMGGDIYSSFPEAASLFKLADEALGFSLSEICFNGPEDKLKETSIAQPAILTVSVIAYRLALANKIFTENEIVSAAGHSLGEYSALVAVGALDFADAVTLVNKRGQYMQEAVPLGIGKMVAVLGKEVAEIEGALAANSEGVAQIANINAPGQIVVAGDKTGVDGFLKCLGNAKSVELAVSAPFHCSLMKPAEEKLAIDLAKTSFNKSSIPVYCNFTAAATSDAGILRSNLVSQVCAKVRWVESMQNAVKETAPTYAIEFGSGNVLTGLLKRIDNSVPRINLGDALSITNTRFE